jgi:hypothetical protein
MSFRRGMFGLGRFAWLFVIAVSSVAACSSENEGDDDGDDSSGGTSPGGGTGGTAGTGGAMPTGGTSSLSSQCATYCQRTAACPGLQPCQETCVSGANDAAALGCASQYQRALDCSATVADACAPGACTAEVNTLFDCISGGPTPAGCAPTGTGPTNGDCVALCQGSNACPGVEPVDCATYCNDAAARAAMYGCTVQYNWWNGCFSTCTNPCALTGTECFQEALAYGTCITCGIDPSDPVCPP